MQSMSKEIELKECPFCGGEAYFRTPEKLMHSISSVVVGVECTKCGAAPYAVIVPECWDDIDKKKAVAKRWNRRNCDKV